MRKASSTPARTNDDRRLTEVVADAVVAAYVHEISDRHAAPAPGEDRGGDDLSDE
jgi:hypothetical protein